MAKKQYTIQEIVSALGRELIFVGIPPNELADLVRRSTVERFRPSAVIWCEREVLQSLDLVLRGSVRFLRLQRLVRELKATALYGYRSAIGALPSSTDIVAGMDGADILRLPAALCRQLIYQDPTLAFRIIVTLGSENRDCEIRCQQLDLSPDLRVWDYLRRKAVAGKAERYNAKSIAKALGLSVRQVRDAMRGLAKIGRLSRSIQTQEVVVHPPRGNTRSMGEQLPIVDEPAPDDEDGN